MVLAGDPWRPNTTSRDGPDACDGYGFPHPHPQISGIEKQLLSYEREDGVPLSGTLYLPANRKEGERLPMLVWAYPREYTDPKTAGQVRAAPTRFTRLRGTSPLLFLTQGYAVLDGAAMPVVGDPENMNDTLIPQLTAAAAIDAAAETGAVDPGASGRRGSFVWRVHDGQPARPFGSVPGRDRPLGAYNGR